MASFLKWLLFLPVAVIIVIFAVVNRQSVTVSPLGLTLPCITAEVCVTDVAPSVSTEGAAGEVLSVASPPCAVPPALVATMRKW